MRPVSRIANRPRQEKRLSDLCLMKCQIPNARGSTSAILIAFTGPRCQNSPSSLLIQLRIMTGRMTLTTISSKELSGFFLVSAINGDLFPIHCHVHRNLQV